MKFHLSKQDIPWKIRFNLVEKALLAAIVVVSVLAASCNPVVGQALTSRSPTSDQGVLPTTTECQVLSAPIPLGDRSFSYETMRNYLLSDRLPASEEVRVEEFVDFFATGYEADGDDFSLDLDVAPSPFAQGKVLMRLVVQAPDSLPDISMPEGLILLTDISDSMDGLASDEFSSYGLESLKKYELVNVAVEHFLSSLPDDTVVSYEFGSPRGYSHAPRPLEVTESGDIWREIFLDIFRDVDRQRWAGGVNYFEQEGLLGSVLNLYMAEHEVVRYDLSREAFLDSVLSANLPSGPELRVGLDRGVLRVRHNENIEGSVLVLVFSGEVMHIGDLDFDSGRSQSDMELAARNLLSEIRRDDKISLAVIGVSVSPSSSDILETVAEFAGGTYHRIHLSEQAKHLFADNPQRLLSVAAEDVSIEMDFNPDAVASYRLLGFDGRSGEVCEETAESSFTARRTNLGEDYTILYELDLMNSPDSLLESLAEVTLKYRRPGEGGERSSKNVFTAQVSESFEESNSHFRVAAVAAEFAEALRDSPYPQAADLAKLIAEADTLAEEFPIDWDSELNPSDFVIPELADLIRSAAFLMHTRKSSPTG